MIGLGRSNQMDVDVIVVGAGNAGLCAAIAARQRGRNVLVLERAPFRYRGGNSALTMNFRFPHETVEEVLALVDPKDRRDELDLVVRSLYLAHPQQDYLDDLIAAASGKCDLKLAHSLSVQAADTCKWLYTLGHRWTYKALQNSIPRSTPVTLKGGGAALQKHNFRVAEALGVCFRYGTRMKKIEELSPERVVVLAETRKKRVRIAGESIVLACGGFEANREMRELYLGPEWRDVALRGIPYNSGDGLMAAMDQGAAPAGDWSSCHATPQSSRVNRWTLPGSHERSQADSRYLFQLGITVNQSGERFFDEGEDLPNLIYAKLGSLIIQQPGKIAFQLFDHSMIGLLPDGYFSSKDMRSSENIEVLGRAFNIPPRALRSTVEEFNRGAHGDVAYGNRDGKSYMGRGPSKSNWAKALNTPPYYLVPVRAGLTFTFGGIRVDESARVLDAAGSPLPAMYACGEIVGGLFSGSYVGGSGLMLGAWLGRKAGMQA